MSKLDDLQNQLASTVFDKKIDAKKAAGRVLGTSLELIVYYLLLRFGVGDNITFEDALREFGYPSITHRVEFSLRPIIRKRKADLKQNPKSLVIVDREQKDRVKIQETILLADGSKRNLLKSRPRFAGEPLRVGSLSPEGPEIIFLGATRAFVEVKRVGREAARFGACFRRIPVAC